MFIYYPCAGYEWQPTMLSPYFWLQAYKLRANFWYRFLEITFAKLIS